ncbi:MAG: tetratricopeptide repeat protein [Sedimenticola sp.]|nr:tetratricopeptide repeat protein [Sedimenticola sp.]
MSAKQTLSKRSYQVLETTQSWIDAGESSRAIKRLKELVLETAEQPYEQAIVLQSLAHAFISVENYAAAIPNLQRSLALNVLPEGAAQQIRYNLAQLYMATEGYKEAALIMEQWLRSNAAAPAEAYVLLGSAYLQLKQYKKATGPLRKAIEMSEAPKESWYQNLLAAYSELKDYKKCTGLLRTMLRRFPSRSVYWSQLAGFEVMLQRYQQALAVMELAYLQGYLKSERDLLNLAQLYAMRDAAYKAGALLEKEIKAGRVKTTRKNWEQLANAWQQARELAGTIAALEQAVKLEPGGKLNLRLGQLYMEVKRWNDAERIIQQVIDRKNDNDELRARAWLLLGIAHYENGRIETSAFAFQSAKNFPHVRKDADQWLSYLDQH